MPVTEEFVFDNKNILERYTCGFKIRDYIGSGCWGSTFETDSSQLIVKITKDFEEVGASQFVMDLRRKGYEAVLFPGLAEIYHIEKVQEIDDDCEDLYVIVRENIIPIEESNVGLEADELDECLYVIEEHQAYTRAELSHALITVEKIAPYLAQSIKELWFYGRRLIDLGIENLGVTRKPRLGVPAGTIVMFDISFEGK